VKSLHLTQEEARELRRTMLEYTRKGGREPGEGLERRLIAFFSVPVPGLPEEPEETPNTMDT
jgi:hypothetical protein